MRDGASQFQELSDILEEIAGLEQHGGALIPDLVAIMKRGIFLPTGSFVTIVARLKNTQLLNAALEQNCGRWPLDDFQRCELLRAGFHQFQQPLLEKLFQVFEQDDQPIRSAIVDALAVVGTASANEMLSVIEYRSAGRLPELSAELDLADQPFPALNQLQRGENLDARKEFLGKVRIAIRQVASRPDPEIVNPDTLAVQQAGTIEIAESIEELLKREEGQRLEFKSALRWDNKAAAVDPKLEYRVLCVIAAFANANGGTMLIGIDPQKQIVGLKNDYVSINGDQDAFARRLTQLVSGKCGKVFAATCLEISFDQIGQNQVCRVLVREASNPVFIKGEKEDELYVRSGSSNSPLKGKDLAEYVQSHFAK